MPSTRSSQADTPLLWRPGFATVPAWCDFLGEACAADARTTQPGLMESAAFAIAIHRELLACGIGAELATDAPAGRAQHAAVLLGRGGPVSVALTYSGAHEGSSAKQYGHVLARESDLIALARRFAATTSTKDFDGVISEAAAAIRKAQAIAAKRLPWPAALPSAAELTDYVLEHATEEIDDEFVYENMRGFGAVLVRAPTASIKADPRRADVNVREEKKERRYAKLAAETCPPLLLDHEGAVEDGHHRLRVQRARDAAAKRGSWMPCYLKVDDRLDLSALLGTEKPETRIRPR